jgi:hypothetical protein
MMCFLYIKKWGENMEIYGLLSIIGLCLIAVSFVWYYINKRGFRQTAIDLILEAEKTKLANQEKMDYTIDKFILLLPVPFRFLVTRNLVNKFIQKIFDEVKQLLNYKGE